MKPTSTVVAIVIPVYNESQNLGACLDAIARQTVAPAEVIVVDNNSSDDSVEIAKRYPFVEVISETKQGIVFARNAGFDAVKSNIIGRIDADSRLRPGWVEAVQRYYSSEEHIENGVSGRGYYYNLRWPVFAGMLQHDIAFRYNRLILGGYILWGSNMAIPRSVWERIRGLTCVRDDIHEDIDLAIHMKKHKLKVDFRKSMVTGVRMRRVHSDRSKLWTNLMLWPRTFRSHGFVLWPLAWLGAVFLFLVSSPLRILETLTIKFFDRPKRSRKK